MMEEMSEYVCLKFGLMMKCTKTRNEILRFENWRPKCQEMVLDGEFANTIGLN